jgi:hypothetical protein
LNNTDYDEIIKGALVTYRWYYGQGELTDPDDDGVYETFLYNVPGGVHPITITAFAGDNYDFETFEITLSVTQTAGPDLTWLIYVLSGGALCLGLAILLYQTHFKYPPIVRKIRKLRKSVRKGKKGKPILLKDRNDILIDSFQVSKEILESEQIEKIKKSGGETP